MHATVSIMESLHDSWNLGAIQVLHNADGGGGGVKFSEK